jgi:hypothetical protein
MLWGGTAFNFGKIAPQMRSYIASTDRMARVVAQEEIDVILSGTPARCHFLTHAAHQFTERAPSQKCIAPD